MKNGQQNYTGPFLAMVFLFLIVGFLTTANTQFQGPLKEAFLSDAGALKNTFATLITFSWFLAYPLSGPVGSRWVNVHGYKGTLLRGLMVMAIGLALFFVVFGNLFPLFHRLNGGKGIVTMIGAAAAIHPIVAALLLIVFVLSIYATKLVAFGSVAISLLYPLFIRAFANYGLQVAMAVFVTFFVLFAHRHNYRRVQEGKEEKFYFSHYLKKKKAEDGDDDK